MGEAYNRNKLSNVIMHAPSYITSNSKYSKIFKNISFNKDINNDSEAKKIAEEAKKIMQSQNWTINHYSHSSDFTEMESAKTLNDLCDKEEEEECFNGNSYPADEKVLRTLPFIFFTLVPNPNIDLPVVNHNSKTSKPFFNIPLVSCSIDLISISSAGGMCHCFNGSSEEVKEQIAIHYINKLFATYGLDEIKKLSPQEIVNNCNNMIQNDQLEIRIPTHISSGKWEEIYLLTKEDMSYVNFPEVEIIFKQNVARQAFEILKNTWLPPSEKILVANDYETTRAKYLALTLIETFCNQLNSEQIENFDAKKIVQICQTAISNFSKKYSKEKIQKNMNLKFDEEIHLCLEDELGLKDKTNFLKDNLNQQIYSQGIISSNKIAENLISSLRQNIKIKDFQTVDQTTLLHACSDVFCCSVFFKSGDLKLKFHPTNFNQIANKLTVSDFNKTFYLFYSKFILSRTSEKITRLQTKLDRNQWSKIFGEDTFEEDN